MRKLNLDEVKQIGLNILVYIDKICREENLRYSIFYGTLLGAVRHKGFIPWDDDIDIVMPRSDYQKLLKILEEKNDYLLLSFETRSGYRYPFAKLIDPGTSLKSSQYFNYEDPDLGVFVDIFPLDGVPSDENQRKQFAYDIEEIRKNMMDTLGSAYARTYSPIKAALKRILLYPHHRKLLKVGDYDYWKNLYMRETIKFEFSKCEYCGYMEFVHLERGLFPVEWFDSYKDIEFEGYKFKAISETETFLTKCYGDYMKLPPENEQVTHHPYEAFQK